MSLPFDLMPPPRPAPGEPAGAGAELVDDHLGAPLRTWEWNLRTDRVTWSDVPEAPGPEPGTGPDPAGADQPWIDPVDRERVAGAVRQALRARTAFAVEFRALPGDGSVRWVRCQGQVVIGEGGEPARMVGIAQDITAPREASQRVEGARQLMAAVFDNLDDLIIVGDADGAVTLVNRAAEECLGVSSAGFEPGRQAPLQGLHHADGTPIPVDDTPLTRTLRGEPVRDLEVMVTARNRMRRTMIASGQRFTAAGGRPGAVLVLHDVTERRRAEAEAAFTALHDPLTGLPNRAAFTDRVHHALRQGRRRGSSTAVLCVDLDHFSEVNAVFGNQVGDQALVEVAVRLRRALRPGEGAVGVRGTVARAGGDEFLIMVEATSDRAVAAAIASRVAGAVSEPIEAGGQSLNLTASVGIALGSDPDADPDVLLLEADAAMRRAKERGRGQCEFFAEGMRLAFARRAEEELALRHAIDGGELRLVYQPKVSILSERIVGVEALVRWEHPTRGMVPPGDFIPLAEGSGLIVPLGRWVLEEACRQAVRWRAQLPDQTRLLLSVNVSARQFDADLVDTVRAIVASTGMDPTSLCLEVTESTVMTDVDASIATLRDLAGLGVTLSIDDFGTGYSSLAYLRRFPLDELKVDRSFVEALGSDPDATAIVAAVVATANALDLTVVAEGVETIEQLECLRTLGCEQAQGFHFFRPQPPAAIPELLIAEVTAQATRRRQRRVDGGPGESRGRDVALVVDDAADIRQLAQMSLTAAGMEAHGAESGEMGLHLARTLRPDCVVLDINLPGMSGLDVCRRLRADPRTRDITIVMLTAEAEAADKAEAFSLDADDYIVKPFVPRDLVSRVRFAMRQRESRPSSHPRTGTPV